MKVNAFFSFKKFIENKIHFGKALIKSNYQSLTAPYLLTVFRASCIILARLWIVE